MAAAPQSPDHPHLDLMTRMYTAGQSLAVIGSHFDLPQERIRALLVKAHGDLESLRPETAETMVVSAPAFTEADVAAAQAAIDDCGELIQQLCAAGYCVEETIFRVRAFFPTHSAAALRLAINTSRLHFAEPRTALFTKEGLIAGLLLVFATKNSLTSSPSDAATALPFSQLAEVQHVLQSANANDDTQRLVLTRIHAAAQYLTEHPDSSLGGTEYDLVREQLVAELSLIIERGATAWPPTRQTVADRFGGWNEAVAAAGFKVSKLGRSRGLLRFSEEDYADVMANYVADMGRHGQKPSFASFTAWCKEQKAAGKSYPSPAAVRDFFGGWSAALRSVEAAQDGQQSVWNLPDLG
ncbi:hypothetical protein [Micrococcoides hystricis]|uniref:Uncharacterized protein n=1 Tax=Micrococcoides hystricis TaxID=1572761 RepID=A0ABV6PAM5_9MICC